MEHIFTAQMDLSLFCRTLLEGAVAIEGELGETASGGTFGERGKRRFAKCPKWVIIKLSKYHEQAFPASKRAAFLGRRGRHAGSGAWTKEAKRERAGFVHVQRSGRKRQRRQGAGATTREAEHGQKRRSGSEPVLPMCSGAGGGQRPSRQSITAGGDVADGQITFKPQISPRRKGSAVRG